MPDIKLQFDGKGMVLGDGVTTVGRTSDNAVSFPGDSNVSRYHAEIELRGKEYCLIDLNSSNGTAVNGQKVTGEVYLKSGDEIVFGGSSRMMFGAGKEEQAVEPAAAPDVPVAEAVNAAVSLPSSSAAPQAASGGSNKLLLIAGAICCIAILCVVVAGAVYYFSGPSCSATARISTVEQGETIDKPTDIEIDLKNGQCVAQVVYTVDGKPFATSQESPFSAKIEPNNFPDLTDGVVHALGIVLVDTDGNQMPQTGAVQIAFETRAIEKPETDPEIVITGPQQPGKDPTENEVSLIELSQMTAALAQQFSGGRSYNVSNPAFLQEVKKRTAEYAVPGFYARASKYRDAINVAYAREQNLDAGLGYILAMSRSNFNPEKKGMAEGLWQMTPEFITANGYNGVCGTETLADPSQNCAARASAVYTKALVLGVFEGDMIYSVAIFGKSTTDAGIWKATLPANRVDVWNSIKTAAEREQLVRFFAAGVVAENPQKFGLKNDLPLSELYKLTR